MMACSRLPGGARQGPWASWLYLRGYLAIDPSVRPGFGALSYTVEVDTDASAEILDEIRAAAEKTSPMFDNILRPTPITGTIARLGAPSAQA